MTKAEAADIALRAAGIPIDGVGWNGDGSMRIDYMASATPTQIAAGNALVAGLDLTQAGLDAADRQKGRTFASTLLSSPDIQQVCLRALGKVLTDYFGAVHDYLVLVRAKVNNPGANPNPLPALPAAKSPADLLADIRAAIAAGNGDPP